MIIHAVRIYEDGCLIIRGKTNDYMKRLKRFIAKHEHWYTLLKQRQHRRQQATYTTQGSPKVGYIPRRTFNAQVSYSADTHMCTLTFKCIE